MNEYLTVRLTAFTEAVGRAKDGFRIEEQRNNVPWRDEDYPSDGKQRRYGGYHALAIACREQLLAQGISAQVANCEIRSQSRILKKFLDMVSNGEAPSQLVIAAIRLRMIDNTVGYSWEDIEINGNGTVDDVLQEIKFALGMLGTERKNGQNVERIVSGPVIAIADVREAYRIAKMRARDTGYILDGYNLFPVPKED